VNLHKAESVSDKTYTIEGKEYSRVTSVIDATLGGQSVEAAACEVAKHAKELFEHHLNGEILKKSGRLWTGSEFIETFDEYLPSEILGDQKRLQGWYYRVRQGWLDRGTVLNLFFDQLAHGLEPTALNARDFVCQELEQGKHIGGKDPVPYQCDRPDLLNRCQWLARFWREHKPVITHTQGIVKCDKLKVAGSFDALGVYQDKPTFWELKAGSEQFSHQVQVSTYKNICAGSKKWNCVLLYIKADGYRLVQLTDKQISDGFKAFKSVLPAYQMTQTRRDWKTVAQDSETKREKRTA